MLRATDTRIEQVWGRSNQSGVGVSLMLTYIVHNGKCGTAMICF